MRHIVKIQQKIERVEAKPRIIAKIIPSKLYFILGPVFVIGFLLAQTHPQKRWMRICNVLVLASLYSLEELLLLQTGALVYTNWTFWNSTVVNIIAMAFISWFSIVVLKKERVMTH